jgi:hypothetical protein
MSYNPVRDWSGASVCDDNLKPTSEETLQERLKRLHAVKVLMPGVGEKREFVVCGKFERLPNARELNLHSAIGLTHRGAMLFAKSGSDFVPFVERLHIA